MRSMKRSTRRILIACVCILVIIVYMSYMTAMERNYPQIFAVYDACREKTEEIYALMLPYVESNDLDWYGCHSSITPWQEDAEVLLKELVVAYEKANGAITSNAICFEKGRAGNWYMRLNISSGYGRLVILYYSPYDELPYYNDSLQLEGLAYGWSFTANPNY